MAQTTIITPVQEQSDESQEEILLPPTDPNAEIIELADYKLVYCGGACPRTYRVYKAHSMIGLLFEHITHWSNAVDKIRYAQAMDAAIGLDEFMEMAKISTAIVQQPPTQEELLDKEFDALTFDEWEQLKKYVPTTKARDLLAA
ncbi:hypothetical protein [Nostoc sp. MG11]|uniref:hypothetical protein n=1 Tax=Nostoc sp. MG11 TaxID=2721166 RepID=UPI0018660101|nr:hypothetical protein [Nostoc sp. MG11]